MTGQNRSLTTSRFLFTVILSTTVVACVKLSSVSLAVQKSAPTATDESILFSGFAKIVPIEVHECLDYLLGGFLVAAPFFFGFAHNAPIISVLMSGSGLTLIIMALVTDYRAFSRRRN